MRSAVIISFIFHVIVITSTMVVLPIFNRDRPNEMRVIPIEMVSIGKVTKLKAQEKESEPVKARKNPPKKKEPERKVEMPPEPPKLASNMPLPDIKAKPKEKPKKKIEEKKSVEVAANRVPDVIPKAKPRLFNSGKLAALLDKREATQPDIIEKLKDKDYGKERIVSDIDARQQMISIADAIDKHIFDNNCWNPPAGAKGAEGLRVTIQIHLSLEGKLIGTPRVKESARMNQPGQEFFRTAAESALRAVWKCTPYDFLPKEQYNLWRDVEIIFDPETMLNG